MWREEYTRKQKSHGMVVKATRALPRAWAFGMSMLGSPETALVPLNPNIFSDMYPTNGVANAATAPSKHLSNEYTRFRWDGGTISAKMGLLAQGAGHAVDTANRKIDILYNKALARPGPSGSALKIKNANGIPIKTLNWVATIRP